MAASDIKKKVYDFLEVVETEGEERKRDFDIIDISLAVLIVLNIVAAMLESVPSMRSYMAYFEMFEIFSIIVFSIEYCTRLWACTADKRYVHPLKGRIGFMLTPMALIDLMCILPFYIPFFGIDLRSFRVLRLMRLLRIFKLARYSRSLQTIGFVVNEKKGDLAASIVVVVVLLVFSATLMFYVENSAQPEAFESIPHTMWWAVATLTTVGYGDVYPVTPVGRILAGVIALVGVGIVALPAGILASGFSEYHAQRLRKQEIQEQQLEKDVVLCPHCGKYHEV